MLPCFNGLHFVPRWPFFSSDPSPVANISNLNQLMQNFRSNSNVQPLTDWKKEIKAFIYTHTNQLDELDRFLKDFIQWGISQKSADFFSELSDVLDLETLQTLARHKIQTPNLQFHSAVDLAKELVHDYPLESNFSFKDKLYVEWQKFRPLIFSFIPNVFNLFLEAFNFLDSQKKFTNLWDKYLILEIVYKFVLIPFSLIQILNPILVTPIKVYAVAAFVIIGGGLLVAAYQRWFKPIPREIVNCKNLDRQIGLIKPKVGQTVALEKMITALISGSNVLIVGKSGEGKTALVHQLVQMKRQETLPKQLADLRHFSLNCADLMGNGTFGHAEMINQTKERIEGIEDKIMMFFDDVDALANNPNCMQSFKQCFMNEDEPNPLFVATTTVKGYEKMQALDTDGSFMRRVVLINLETALDEQCELVINEFVKQHAKHLPITRSAIKQVLELSKSDEYLPQVGRLVKITNIMRSAIGRCEWAYSPNYISKDLSKAKEEYAVLERKPCHGLIGDPKVLQQRQELRHKIRQIENRLFHLKTEIAKIKVYIQHKLHVCKEHCILTHRLAKQPMNSIKEQDQKLYLLYQLYSEDVFNQMIKEAINQIKDQADMQIDEDLVKSVFNALKAERQKLPSL